MRKKTKTALSVILCAALLFALVPSSAFAANTDMPVNYVEIKFKEGCSDKILVGEATEIYAEYAANYEDVWLVWSVSGDVYADDSFEYITDSETGMTTGIKVDGVSAGRFYASVKMINYAGYEFDSDTVVIHINEPDTRTEKEKLEDELEDLKGGLTMGLYMFVIMPVVSLLSVPVLAVMKLLGLPPWR